MQKVMNLRESMDLSDQQRDQIRQVVKSYRRDIKAQMIDAKEARETMRDAVKKHGADSAEAEEAAAEVGETAASRAKLVARIFEEVRPLLTEEQQKTAEDGRAEISEWIEGRLSARD